MDLQWWLILLIGLVFGVIVIVVAGFASRAGLMQLQMALTTMDEHKRSADRLKVRVEAVQAEIAQLQAKLPPTRR